MYLIHKRILRATLVLILLFTNLGFLDVFNVDRPYPGRFGAPAARANPSPGEISGKVPPLTETVGAVLMDANSGQVLFAQNADLPVPMASTTKVMTALLVLEQASLDELAVTPEEATRMEGTRVYLEAGEIKTVEELLYASLLNSANDAAWVLAAHVGQGSVENFVAMMNRRAQELGAVNTNFVNPTGLHEPQHFSTPRDMALIARQALNNPVFRQMVVTRTRPWAGNAHQVNLYNLNRLLWSYSGITGVKTGYTSAAKNCLIASAQREERELVSVILGSGSSIWEESAQLLDYGFENYTSLNLIDENQAAARLGLKDGRSVELLASRGLSVSLPRGKTVQPEIAAEFDHKLKAPIPAGTIAGYLTCTVDGQTLVSIPLITAQDIPLERLYFLPVLISGCVSLGGLICWHKISRQKKRKISLRMRLAARRAARQQQSSRGY